MQEELGASRKIYSKRLNKCQLASSGKNVGGRAWFNLFMNKCQLTSTDQNLKFKQDNLFEEAEYTSPVKNSFLNRHNDKNGVMAEYTKTESLDKQVGMG